MTNHAASTFFGGHDGLLCDLDGVVYAGGESIPGAVETVSALAERGVPVGFVTNNASRPPEAVAEQLRRFGLEVSPSHVFGSAPAGVDLLEERLTAAGHEGPARVLVVGSVHLADLVAARGHHVVETAAERPDAVLQGFDPRVDWSRLAEAAYAVNAGADWVATNLDLSIPRAEGVAPGNGALALAVTQATGVIPVAAGKPEPRLFHTAAAALGLQAPLMVGDRLDTDIRGGNAAGMETVLVLTGVDSRHAAGEAPEEDRPTWIVDDMTALLGEPAEAARG
ncbi:HAD-IIA family hydrolase [Micrococcus sp. ACRRV]|uniref:HAD-IIA family hydrolase n=1 Tax=Micrococcus sp. ACRRV TaxID=2918203 RepID=UPI001EF31E0E|nr:HAD-IIA family hydrolase [Micrococcus sp. ACRRV]MCG7423203.1 HAD-IIA family hydrolase [Micrococcus sp. ACRRV]